MSSDAVNQPPANFGARREEAMAAHQRGDRAAALAGFQSALAVEPNDRATLQDIATELRELGRLQEADAAYRKVLSLGSFAPADLGLALLARRRGDHAAALAHFQAAEAAEPNDLWTWQNIATELRELGRGREAEAGYRKALALEGSFAPAHIGLGLIARQSGDRIAALGHFQSADAAKPNDPWTWRNIAVELRELGRFDEAEAYGRRMVERDPTLASAIIFFARCIRHRCAPSDVLALLLQASRAAPNDIDVQLEWANELYAQGRLDPAERVFERILALDPQYTAALIGQGQVAKKRGDRDEARRLLTAAVVIAADTEAAQLALAQELADEGLFDEAGDMLEQIALRRPDHLGLLMQRGHLLRSRRELAAASRAFAAAAERHPQHCQAYVERASAELRQGHIDEALQSLAEALEVDPRHPGALVALADYAEQSDDLPLALTLYRHAATLHPTNVGAQLGLARSLAQMGNKQDCLALFRRLLDSTMPQSPILIAKARIERRFGLHAQACASIERASTLFPKDFTVWLARVRVYIEVGRWETASDMLASPPPCGPLQATELPLYRGWLALDRWDVEGAWRHFEPLPIHGQEEPTKHELSARAALLDWDLDRLEAHLRSNVEAVASRRGLRGLPQDISETHYGRLLDEARSKPLLAACLRGAAHETPEARRGALIEAIRSDPEFTPAAMALFVALRREGALVALDDAKAAGGADPIPRELVQFWDDPTPPADIIELGETWTRNNPTLAYRRFCETDARSYLLANHSAPVLAAFERSPEPAMKADIFRLAYLLDKGGYYADADDRCVAPLEAINPGGRSLIVCQEDLGSIGNNFIATVRHHRVIALALAKAVAAVNGGNVDMLWLSTGPGLLTRACASIAAEDDDSLAPFLANTLILDRHEFLRCAVPHCLASYKHTQRHWSRSAFPGRQRPVADEIRAVCAKAGIPTRDEDAKAEGTTDSERTL